MAEGYSVGDSLDLAKPGHVYPTIVGTVASTTTANYPVAAGPPGSLSLPHGGGSHTWLVDGAPVGWSTVRELNRHGASVLLTRGDRHTTVEVRARSSAGSSLRQASTMTVGVPGRRDGADRGRPARRSRLRRGSAEAVPQPRPDGGSGRDSPPVASGDPRRSGRAGGDRFGVGRAVRHRRRMVGGARAASFSSAWFGPFEVPWQQLAGVAVFGLVSALLAAAVPAPIASRQDVVAVLGGRRGDRRPSLRSPALGIVLLAAGVALCRLRGEGSRQRRPSSPARPSSRSSA